MSTELEINERIVVGTDRSESRRPVIVTREKP